MSSQWWYQWHGTLSNATICDHTFAKYNIHKDDPTHQLCTCAIGNVLTLG